MNQDTLRRLCAVIKTDIVLERTDETLVAFFESISESPLMNSPRLRGQIRSVMPSVREMGVYTGEMGTVYAVFPTDDGLVYIGPLCTELLNYKNRQAIFRRLGFECEDSHSFPVYTTSEVRNIIHLTADACGITLQNSHDLSLGQNSLQESDRQIRQDQMKFLLNEEAEDDAEVYRHSYQEEQIALQAIREGRTEDAIRMVESMDSDSGRLSGKDLRHWQNISIIELSLAARAAIEGGISPELSYRVSGYYIQKCDVAAVRSSVLSYRNQGLRHLTDLVARQSVPVRSASLTDRCKAYIKKHYREKLYLQDIAEYLSVSPGYLSKLFKKEAGVCLQEYINQERIYRAANLLLYSDYSLAEISAYVNFPNQSYFGRIFKKYKGMTPKEFRKLYS